MEKKTTNASQSRQKNAIREQYEVLDRSALIRNWTRQIPAVIYATRVTRPHGVLREAVCDHDKPVYVIAESGNRALVVLRHCIKTASLYQGVARHAWTAHLFSSGQIIDSSSRCRS
jgi:hypothetical protein